MSVSCARLARIPLHVVRDEDLSLGLASLIASRCGVFGFAEKEARKKQEEQRKSRQLAISFIAMVIVGLGNKIFQVRLPGDKLAVDMLLRPSPVCRVQVLQTYPMNNYPLFTNTLTTFVYLPASFACKRGLNLVIAHSVASFSQISSP